MSDLQCPAVVVLVPRELLEAWEGALDLGDTRLAGVFVATAPPPDSWSLVAATRLADDASCPVAVLADVAAGADLEEAVEHLADLHRGESIAVVARAETIGDVLGGDEAPTAPVAVAIDGSGWVVLRGR